MITKIDSFWVCNLGAEAIYIREEISEVTMYVTINLWGLY